MPVCSASFLCVQCVLVIYQYELITSRFDVMLAQEKWVGREEVFSFPSPLLLFKPHSYSLKLLFVSPQASSKFKSKILHSLNQNVLACKNTPTLYLYEKLFLCALQIFARFSCHFSMHTVSFVGVLPVEAVFHS